MPARWKGKPSGRGPGTPEAELRRVLKNVQEGRAASFYLLVGEDDFRRDRFARTLARHLAGETEGTNAEEIAGAELTAGRFVELTSSPAFSFFDESRRVITLRAFRHLSPGLSPAETGEAERMTRAVERGLPPGTALVITVEGEVDEKSELLRALAERGCVLEFAPLQAPEDRAQFALSRLARLNVRASSDALNTLIALCGPDTRTLASEADKVAAYAGPGGMVRAEDVRAVASPTPEARGFDLADAVVERRADDALTRARELLRQGEHPLPLLTLLANRLRALIHARVLMDEGCLPPTLHAGARYGSGFKRAWQEFAQQEKRAMEADDGTGFLELHPYVAYKTLAAAQNYSVGELIRGLEALLRADWALKGQEHLPDGAILELAILEICQKQ